MAAYRDRYQINSRSALGDEPRTDAQKRDAAHAQRAIRRARAIADDATRHSGRTLTVTASAPTLP